MLYKKKEEYFQLNAPLFRINLNNGGFFCCYFNPYGKYHEYTLSPAHRPIHCHSGWR